MKIRRFFAKDMRDAMNQVKQELGSDAVIMSKTKLEDGIEVVAAYDQEPKVQRRDPQSKPAAKKNAPRQFASALSAATSERNATNATPTLSEIIGDQGPDSLKALLDRGVNSSAEASNTEVKSGPSNKKSSSEKPVVNVSDSQHHKAMDDMRDELSSIRNVLQFQVAELFKEKNAQEQPHIHYLREQLACMGLTNAIVEELLSYAPDTVSEREAWVFLLKLLANKIKVPKRSFLQTGGIVSLIGPTGAGKTTTAAKLAAQFASRHGADSVALVTIDSYRIAAFEQLATYGKIIGCTVKKAANEQQLSDVLQQLKNKKLVLIDTAGFNQRDSRLMTQTGVLTGQNNGKIKHVMVLPANGQKQALVQSIKSYDGLSIEGCILSKIDETFSLGEAISVLIEQQLPATFITDGQKVPEDLKAAESRYLVSTAAKLYQQYSRADQTKAASQ